MKMLPGFVVINPCDYNQTKAATMAIANYDGPVYLRFGRPGWPIFIPEDQEYDAILESVKKTGCLVSAEEHQRLGGLGGSISSLLAENHPAPMQLVAVNDSFGESGPGEKLLAKYGLGIDNIYEAAKKAISRK